MGVDLLVIGNHKVEYNDPKEIRKILSEVSDKTCFRIYAQQLKEFYVDLDLPQNEENYKIVPYSKRNYLSVSDQFQKAGYCTFKGYKDCGVSELNISLKLIHLYPCVRWTLFSNSEVIYSAISNFANSFFYHLGCTEIIYLPEAIDISEQLLGPSKPSGAFFLKDNIEFNSNINRLFHEVIYDIHHDFEDLKTQLNISLGAPAKNWGELHSNFDTQYLIEKL